MLYRKLLVAYNFLVSRRLPVTLSPWSSSTYGELPQLHGNYLGSERNSAILTSVVTLLKLKIVDQVGLGRL